MFLLTTRYTLECILGEEEKYKINVLGKQDYGKPNTHLV